MLRYVGIHGQVSVMSWFLFFLAALGVILGVFLGVFVGVFFLGVCASPAGGGVFGCDASGPSLFSFVSV